MVGTRFSSKVFFCLLTFIAVSGLQPFNNAAQAQSKPDEKSMEKESDSEESKEMLDAKLTYPELEVTPRASDRLDIEQKRESKTGWAAHLPVQFAALMTIYASSDVEEKANLATTEQDDFDSAKRLAFGVGAGWIGLTGILAATYRPYTSGRNEIAKLPKGTAREQLTRERLAEEALYAPASLSTKIKWFSALTNLYVNVRLFEHADSDSRMIVGLAAVSSLAPFLFESRWNRVADQHREYKKKIYGPLASSAIFAVSDSRFAPGVALRWVF